MSQNPGPHPRQSETKQTCQVQDESVVTPYFADRRIKFRSVVPTLAWEVPAQSKHKRMRASLEESLSRLAVVTQKAWDNLSPHPVPRQHLNHRTILPYLSYLFVLNPEEMERILHWWSLPLTWRNSVLAAWVSESLCLLTCVLHFSTAGGTGPMQCFSCIYVCFMKTDKR